MVLRVEVAFGALQTQPFQIRPQPGERPLIQKTREVIRGVRKQFPSPDTEKEVEVFAFHRFGRHGMRCFGERSEEHTSELQSLMRISYAVFCLKKKQKKIHNERKRERKT